MFLDDFVVLDVEASGGNLRENRVIEIGLLEFKEGNFSYEWSSLVNPQCQISWYVKKLTTIDDEMLEEAPVFKDLVPTLLEKLNEKILVAHNVKFDYQIIQREFAREGVNFSADYLCSLELYRSLYPNLNKHGIDSIVKRYNILCELRHRALLDAKIIVEFLNKLYNTHKKKVLRDLAYQLINK